MPGKKTVSCSVETTLGLINGRWKVLIIHHLMGEVRRFGELQRLLVGVSHRTLTQQLRQMETDGLIRREVFPEVPPRVEYSLTPLGDSLRPVLMAMHDWGEDYAQRSGASTPADDH